MKLILCRDIKLKKPAIWALQDAGFDYLICHRTIPAGKIVFDEHTMLRLFFILDMYTEFNHSELTVHMLNEISMEWR